MRKLIKRVVNKIVIGLSPKVSGTPGLPHNTERLIDLDEIWTAAEKASGRLFEVNGVTYREVDPEKWIKTHPQICRCYYCRNKLSTPHDYVYRGSEDGSGLPH